MAVADEYTVVADAVRVVLCVVVEVPVATSEQAEGILDAGHVAIEAGVAMALRTAIARLAMMLPGAFVGTVPFTAVVVEA